MSKIINKTEVRDYYLKLTRGYKSLLNELSEYEIDEVRSFAIDMIDLAYRDAEDKAKLNPDFEYPNVYKGHIISESLYWLKNDEYLKYAITAAEDVKDLIDNFRAKESQHQRISAKNKRKQFITEQLSAIDINKGWEYVFRNETDFNIFADLLTNFFDSKEYAMPKEIINLRKGTKTRVAKELKTIYQECKKTPLKSDKDFFEIIRVLDDFKDLSDNEIYSAITR